MGTTLYAGAARRAINPQLGTGMPGLRLFGAPIQAIESDLTATVLVLGDGDAQGRADRGRPLHHQRGGGRTTASRRRGGARHALSPTSSSTSATSTARPRCPSSWR